MTEVAVSAGTIEYQDSGGDGPVLVFLHGVAMDGSVWAPVVADLRRDHRCVVPTLGHGRRLAALLPDAQLAEIPDSYTLIMRDQPEAFASAVREFIRGTTGPRPEAATP
jgi:pimeloyl-ACP methyl ester carboxylesterase